MSAECAATLQRVEKSFHLHTLCLAAVACPQMNQGRFGPGKRERKPISELAVWGEGSGGGRGDGEP